MSSERATKDKRPASSLTKESPEAAPTIDPDRELFAAERRKVARAAAAAVDQAIAGMDPEPSELSNTRRSRPSACADWPFLDRAGEAPTQPPGSRPPPAIKVLRRSRHEVAASFPATSPALRLRR